MADIGTHPRRVLFGLSVDAVWSMRHLLAPGAVSELWTFFPDPWPKQRHQRRRLVGPEFAHLAATRRAMAAVLDAEPLLENVYDGPAPRFEDRPLTRFERRGLEAGRDITDLVYRRR